MSTAIQSRFTGAHALRRFRFFALVAEAARSGPAATTCDIHEPQAYTAIVIVASSVAQMSALKGLMANLAACRNGILAILTRSRQNFIQWGLATRTMSNDIWGHWTMAGKDVLRMAILPTAMDTTIKGPGNR